MTMSAIRTQVTALVHASVPPNSTARVRQERFILSRLVVGALALGLVPAYLAWRGTLGALEALMVVAAALPLVAVVVLSRSGRLDIAHVLSAAAFSLFVIALAGMTGGAASPVLFWLAAIPVEGMAAGSRSHVLRGGAIALAALAAVMLLQLLGAFPGAWSWADGSVPAMSAAAIVAAVAMTILTLRRHEEDMQRHRSTDARARLALDNLGELVTWHDLSGSIVFASAAAKALTGAEPRELCGRGLFDRVHVADRPLFLKALSDAAHGAAQTNICFRTLFVPPGGAGEPRIPVSLWLEMQAHRVEDSERADGVAVVCVMRDITARRMLDEERARGQADALKASDVKDQFLATVSHELRTPLNAIIGFSEMLGDESQSWLDDGKRLEYARIIHGSGLHLLDVVNTLLDISKIESGSMAIEQEPVDLAAMARDCCALMALRAQASGISLQQVLGPDLPSLRGDRRALKQIVINLLSNAVKFTPSEGRVVLAMVRDGEMIDLSVSDTGIGIAATDLPQLGEPFFQATGSYDRPYEGTGLGLSVVRGLVGLHGGKLTIESAPGVGTRVSVRLPVGGIAASAPPAKIATFARAPRRGLETKEPVRLTA